MCEGHGCVKVGLFQGMNDVETLLLSLFRFQSLCQLSLCSCSWTVSLNDKSQEKARQGLGWITKARGPHVLCVIRNHRFLRRRIQ